MGRKKEKPSEEVIERLKDLALDAIAFRRTRFEFEAIVVRELPEISVQEARDCLSRTREVVKGAPERDLRLEKEAQVERTLSHIKKAEAAKNWMAVAKLESVLSDLIGSREPIKVEHVLTGAIASVIAQLTPEQHAEIVARQRRTLELAELAERKGLLPEHIVDAEIIEDSSEQKKQSA